MYMVVCITIVDGVWGQEPSYVITDQLPVGLVCELPASRSRLHLATPEAIAA